MKAFFGIKVVWQNMMNLIIFEFSSCTSSQLFVYFRMTEFIRYRRRRRIILNLCPHFPVPYSSKYTAG